MYSLNLLTAIKQELETIFQEKDFLASFERKDAMAIPKIDMGWYTNKRKEEDFPYILISPVEQREQKDSVTFDVILSIGIFSAKNEGWVDIILISEKIRQHFRNKRILDGKFELLNDMKIAYPDEQPFPQWICGMFLSFQLYNVVPKMEEFLYE